MLEWLFSGKCTSMTRLEGKTAVVTGCNTGIGKHTAQDLYRRGCRVIMACRDVAKAEAAAQEIRDETLAPGVGAVVVVRLDLASFASVRQCADHLLNTEPQINLLINNAAIIFCPKALSLDGFELQFATNHLGHFLLTQLLLPRLLKSKPARIIIVTSFLYTCGSIDFDDINMDKPKAYGPALAHNRSKLANILFAYELAQILQGSGVTVYAVHPGTVNTEATRHFDEAYFRGSKWLLERITSAFYKTPEAGAQTTIYCAVDQGIANESGQYYSECKKSSTFAKGRDPVMARRLWDESVKWVGLKEDDTQPSVGHHPHARRPVLH